MRSKEEILEKFNKMKSDKLRELKARYLSRSFRNCKYNVRMDVHGKGKIGFCQNQNVLKSCGKRMFVCNNDSTASRCSEFCCKNTEDGVESLFMEIIKSPSRCGELYPKLAILIWFLQDIDGGTKIKRLCSLIKNSLVSIWKIVSFRWV